MTNTTTMTTEQSERNRKAEQASTIRDQIGRRALMMIGAKDLLVTETGGLQLRIGANAKKVTHVVVELATDDTYTVVFSSRRGIRYAELAREDGLYFDQLCDSITRNTGLYTSL